MSSISEVRLPSSSDQRVVPPSLKLPPDAAPAQIEETANELNTMNCQPMLLNDAPGFLKLTKNGLVQMVVDVAKKPNATEQHLSLLFYHYSLLQRLRRNEPEAWDEVNELMEDD